MMLVALVCRGQQDMRGVAIEFRAGKATIDTTFRNNAQGVRQLRQLAANVARDSNYRLTSLTLGGYASPEGSYQLNKRLARQRCDALRALIDEQLSVPDSIVRYTMDSYIPWDQMEMMVRNSNIEDKDSIIAALRADSTMVRYGNSATIDGRAKAIERSRGTDAWHRLQRAIFPRMRLATAVFITRRITGTRSGTPCHASGYVVRYPARAGACSRAGADPRTRTGACPGGRTAGFRYITEYLCQDQSRGVGLDNDQYSSRISMERPVERDTAAVLQRVELL